MDPNQTLSNAGLPSIGSVYSNVNFPTSVNDIGGSAADKATQLNQGPTDAFTQYMNYAKGLPTPGQTYSSLMSENGIPQMQKTATNLSESINGLEDSINNVEPNVNANDNNSLATESQRQGQITTQKIPLEQALEPQVRNYGNVMTGLSNAEANVSSEVNAQNAANAQMLQAGGMGVTVAEDNAARAMSGFTQDQSNQLQMLLAKAESQQHLDDQEWNTLSSLSVAKQGYDAAIAQIKAKAQTTPTAVGQNGSVYYDQNGKPVFIGGGNSPASSSPIGGGGNAGSGNWSIVG